MTRLILALTRADLRAAPERAVAVAVLLAAAALLPRLLQVDPALRLVLAIGVAGAAAAGATAQHRRRHQVLFLNGARPGFEAGLTAAALVVPGVAAAIGTGLVEVVAGRPSQAVAAVALTLVVPVLVAPLATLLWSPLLQSRRRNIALIVLGVLLAPTVVVPLGAVSLLVGRRLTRAGLTGRAVGSVVAAGVAVGVAVLAGTSETWSDLWLVLTLAGVPLALAVAWLGSSAIVSAGWLLRRLGPLARLAVAPLAERRTVLAPVVAVVALVTTLAVLEGVMGASFGEREAGRDRIGTLLGTAGLEDHQAVVVATVDLPAEQVRELARGAADDTGVRAATIDRLGPGGTQVHGSGWPQPQFPLGISLEVPPTWRVAGTTPPSPSWVGVVTPEDLPALGLDHEVDALARGDAVVLVAGAVVGGRVQLRGPDGSHELPATVAGAPEHPAILLPAALISPARAAELGAEAHSGRVVFVPGDTPIDDAALVGVASRFGQVLGMVAPAGDSDVEDPYGRPSELDLVALEARRPAALGSDQVRSDPGGELNAVPYLSQTWEAGRSEALALGALALLVGLAGTILVLGGNRADDAMLAAQGASSRSRAAMAAVQSAALTGTASVVAVAVGIGLPALGFRGYNARPRSGPATDIPLVVPWELLVGLAALPVLAAVLAAVVTALRRPVSISTVDDLAW